MTARVTASLADLWVRKACVCRGGASVSWGGGGCLERRCDEEWHWDPAVAGLPRSSLLCEELIAASCVLTNPPVPNKHMGHTKRPSHVPIGAAVVAIDASGVRTPCGFVRYTHVRTWGPERGRVQSVTTDLRLTYRCGETLALVLHWFNGGWRSRYGYCRCRFEVVPLPNQTRGNQTRIPNQPAASSPECHDASTGMDRCPTTS